MFKFALPQYFAKKLTNLSTFHNHISAFELGDRFQKKKAYLKNFRFVWPNNSDIFDRKHYLYAEKV